MTQPYPEYRDSEIEWLGQIPEHWSAVRLQQVASYFTSSVDKKSSDDELSVRLCNYTDVYYQERIREDSGEFMSATASAHEIARFGLQVGDVLITKDSEDWRDIAVPALVEKVARDFVCGYHLGIIRPSALVEPSFLFRAMQSAAVNQQLQVASTGVTRYGVQNAAVSEAVTPLPPLAEQRQIAAFLDRATARIDELVAANRLLIERLDEYRTALITRVVTKGLPAEETDLAQSTPMLKDSGVAWLGKVPEHWRIMRLARVAGCLDGRRVPLNSEQRSYRQGAIPYWGANGVLDHLDEWLFDESLVLLGEDGAPFFARNKRVAFSVRGRIWVNNHAHVLRPIRMQPDLLAHGLNITDYAAFIDGSTRDKLTQGDMNDIPILVPPANEQALIVDYLKERLEQVDLVRRRVEDSIERLHEYRSALVTVAVTGKIDVRDYVQHEPVGTLTRQSAEGQAI